MEERTLLVVDDNPDNLMVMEALLTEAFPHCRVLLARDAEQVIDLVHHHVDAGLIDVQMPGIDGTELCRRLKASPRSRHIPVILITAHNSTSAIRARGLDTGADDFISRPIDNMELAVFSPRPQQLACVFHDITERRRAVEALEALNYQLEDKNKELNAIIHASSHDLRSPLVNIQGFSHELERTCGKLRDRVARTSIPPDERERIETLLNVDFPECIHYILSGVARMDRLLVGLLQLSRLERTALEVVPLDMNGIIRDILQTMEFQVKASGVSVYVTDLPPCMGDPTRINRVFSNLLDNAVKYLDPSRPGRICVEGTTQNGQAVYRVVDNGIGIPAEHQDRVFEIFHRLNSKTGVPGEGLGLTSVRRIVERHNGRIRVESEPGKGSTFCITLPQVSCQLSVVSCGVRGPLVSGECGKVVVGCQ